MGAQAMNAAHQISHTAGIDSVKTSSYGAALKTAAQDLTAEDRLRTEKTQYDNNLILRAPDGTEIELINVKIDVTMKNKFQDTSLIRRSGTVKEYIQRENYVIDIKGNLIGDKDKFPIDKLHTLASILQQPESFEVASVLLSKFDITKVVLDNIKFEQNNSRYFNAIPFTLKMQNDEDYTFLVEDYQ